MRLRRHLTTILATTALALSSVVAAEDTPSDSVGAGQAAGTTISCTLAAPSLRTGCYVERPVIVLGPVELALALDAQAHLTDLALGDVDTSHLAVYASVGVYEENWSAWLEVWLPRFAGVTLIGTPDWLRLGFTYTVPP